MPFRRLASALHLDEKIRSKSRYGPSASGIENKLDEWAEQQPDKPGRPEAIHRLVETGLEGNVGEGFFVWRGFPEPNVKRETFI